MPSKNIKDCISELQEKWPKLKSHFETAFLDWRMILTCTHRTPEEQFELFQAGRKSSDDGRWEIFDAAKILTMRDGYKRLSLHNFYPAKAFDVALLNPEGYAVWNSPTAVPVQWQALPEIAKSVGLENGGSWTKLYDWPHMQLPIKGA